MFGAVMVKTTHWYVTMQKRGFLRSDRIWDVLRFVDLGNELDMRRFSHTQL